MGNFHCISSTCARVVYREYLPPVIRYRYPDEDWQTLDADDFEVGADPKHCPGTYSVLIEHSMSSTNARWNNCNKLWQSKCFFTGRFIGLSEKLRSGSYRPTIEYLDNNNITRETGQFRLLRYGNNSPIGVTGGCGNYARNVYQANTVKLISITPVQEPNCCTFTAFKNGAIVHQETREDCPEVEKLDCRLSDISKEIKIGKWAYLERIEVRNQNINLVYLKPLDTPLIDSSFLPENCLNIYKTFTTAPPSLSNFVPLPGAINPYQYIEQICSAENCPPPEYEVICDCDCKDCPPGTCAVECHEHICCYDKQTGLPVLEIPIKDYCQS